MGPPANPGFESDPARIASMTSTTMMRWCDSGGGVNLVDGVA